MERLHNLIPGRPVPNPADDFQQFSAQQANYRAGVVRAPQNDQNLCNW
jgi:hypothetical protein